MNQYDDLGDYFHVIINAVIGNNCSLKLPLNANMLKNIILKNYFPAILLHKYLD